ncbi:ATP-binding protein [Methanomethylovorans sp.]|uniref:sensor histidine kinase n=1 Tax=Methanomethylovorans sp. TaxID=2758717 RepID=UPI00351C39E4
MSLIHDTCILGECTQNTQENTTGNLFALLKIINFLNSSLPVHSLISMLVRSLPEAMFPLRVYGISAKIDGKVYGYSDNDQYPSISVDVVVHGKIRGYISALYNKDRQTSEQWTQAYEILNVLCGSLSNLIEKKELEKLSLESTRHYSALFYNCPVGLFTDKKGSIVHCNHKLTQILDMPENRIVGLHVTALIDSESIWKTFSSHKVSPEPLKTEYEIDLRKGPVKLRSIYLPELTPEGELKGGLGIVEDITKIEEAEQVQQQQKKLLVNTFNAINDLILVLDRDLRIVTSNWKGFEDLSEEERQKHPYRHEILTHNASPCESCHVLEAFATGIPKEALWTNPTDGSIKEMKAYPIFDEDGEAIMVVEHLRDITEIKRSEDNLRKANDELAKANESLQSLDKLKNEFLSNLQHEINTPLTSIKGFSELVHEENLGPLNVEQKKAMHRVVEKTKQLQMVLDSLLFVSTATHGGIKYNFERLPLSNMLHVSLDIVSEKLKYKGITLETNIPYQLPEIVGDADYLPRVFVHILDNAIKFTNSDGKITLSATEEKDFVHLIINDTGIGIAKENLEKVFQMFFQLDGSSTRNYGGNGLGLFMCKIIIEEHKGKIWIDSKEGKGTAVHILLPAYTDPS